MHNIKKAISLTLLTALIISSTMPVHASTIYKYDTLGRLTEATHSSGRRVVYTYDAAGNMTAVVSIINVVYGDVDGNGIVDSNDLARLEAYFSGEDRTFDNLDIYSADVNGDGVLNNADLVRLAAYLSGYDTSPLGSNT